MTVMRGFIISIISGIGFAAIGGMLGYALGVLAPDYYRIMFRIPTRYEGDLVQLGVGLGLTQGFAAGLLVGLAIVVVVAWYNLRLNDRST